MSDAYEVLTMVRIQSVLWGTNHRLTYRECLLVEMLREPQMAYHQKDE